MQAPIIGHARATPRKPNAEPDQRHVAANAEGPSNDVDHVASAIFGQTFSPQREESRNREIEMVLGVTLHPSSEAWASRKA